MRKNKLCFICRKELKSDERAFMLGIDRPHINIFSHYECWQNIKGSWKDFVLSNWEWIERNIIKGE